MEGFWHKFLFFITFFGGTILWFLAALFTPFEKGGRPKGGGIFTTYVNLHNFVFYSSIPRAMRCPLLQRGRNFNKCSPNRPSAHQGIKSNPHATQQEVIECCNSTPTP